MDIIEKRVLKQVTILPQQNSINVQWADQILRDGEIVNELYHRKAYSHEQVAEFSAEVEGAAAYMTAIGW